MQVTCSHALGDTDEGEPCCGERKRGSWCQVSGQETLLLSPIPEMPISVTDGNDVEIVFMIFYR